MGSIGVGADYLSVNETIKNRGLGRKRKVLRRACHVGIPMAEGISQISVQRLRPHLEQ